MQVPVQLDNSREVRHELAIYLSASRIWTGDIMKRTLYNLNGKQYSNG